MTNFVIDWPGATLPVSSSALACNLARPTPNPMHGAYASAVMPTLVSFLISADCSFALTSNGEWDDVNLFRKRVSGRKIAVAVYEGAADDEYRIGRRRNLLHPARRLSLPTRARDDIVARVRTCGAFADVGEDGVVRSSELHAVIAIRHLGHIQDLRSIPQV